MAVNAVNASQPYEIPPPLPYSAEQNQPAPKAPPGSEGHQGGDISSQLVKGNPGGVGAGFGLGIALDAST
jgi:hypothetical protein